MIEILSGVPEHTVGFKISGKLHDEDYKTFVPRSMLRLPKKEK